MAGFDDLIAAAQPYVDTEERAVTAGTPWIWSYSAFDDAGNEIDMTVGFTGSYVVHDAAGALVVDVPVTFPLPGVIKCSLSQTDTGITPGSHTQALTITRTSDEKCPRIIGGGSTFVVLPEGL